MKAISIFKLGVLLMAIIGISLHPACNLIDDDKDDPPKLDVGDTLWIQDIDSESDFISGRTLALSNDQRTFYYAEAGGTLNWTPARIVARETSTGNKIWSTPEMDHVGISSQIIVADDGSIYAIGQYTLYAIDPNTGAFKWTWKVPTELPNPDNPQVNVYTYGQIGAMALTNEDNLILGSIGTGAYTRGIYCVSSDGVKLWHNLKSIGGGVMGRIVIGENDIAYYYTNLGDAPEDLVAIDIKNGKVLWTLDVADITTGANNIVIDDDGTLICAFRKENEQFRKLHRIDPQSSEILWSSMDVASSDRKWLGIDGRVYQWFQFEGGMNVFNMANGQRQPFSEFMNARHLGAINKEGQLTTISSLSGVNKLTVYKQDGTIDWDVRIDGMADFPMLITNDGVIIGIINETSPSFIPKKLVAVQGEYPLATSGWPRIAKDNQNTSNWNK